MDRAPAAAAAALARCASPALRILFVALRAENRRRVKGVWSEARLPVSLAQLGGGTELEGTRAPWGTSQLLPS